MKTILASLFVSILSLTAFASNEHHPHPLPPPQPQPAPIMLGIWHSDQPTFQNGIWIHSEFNFSEYQMTMHAICEFRNPTVHLTVGVASRAAYNQNLIYVYDNADATVNDGYRFCRATFAPSTWEFYFQSADMNHAVIFAPIPSQLRIPVTRIPNY
ncbi:hypothetical protein CIK05_09970 [Bdellovibrio sp. qaytius]|nr:hypothetical protein CIK05_09970 [Bdellovibrio sp. qaytius]